MIQSKLGGTITKRTTSLNTHRYYLGTRDGMIQLAHRINGNIRGHSRQIQFKELCTFLNIVYIAPETLLLYHQNHPHNAWYSGYIDSDGTITASFYPSPSIRIKATSKYSSDVDLFVPVLGGKIYKQTTSYDWVVNDTKTILFVCKYLANFPLYSVKNHRVGLVPLFYKLRTSRAHNPHSIYHSDWKLLETNWNLYKTN